jgi:hypothetical protein
MTDRPLSSDDWVLDLIDAIRAGIERARARNNPEPDEKVNR